MNQTLKLLRANHREPFKWVLDGEMDGEKTLTLARARASGEHGRLTCLRSMGLQLCEIGFKKREGQSC